MRRAPFRLLPVSLLVTLLFGCSPSLLRLSHDPNPERLADLRAEYYSMNPDSPYREQVSRGEVVKGMDIFGVIAAWGSPERRTRDESTAERWVYIDTDQDSGDEVEYALLFKDGLLNAWQSRRSTGGDTAVRKAPNDERPNAQPAEAPMGKRVPKF